jgi:dihydrofolate synthase/folylpolyglutamate synthase
LQYQEAIGNVLSLFDAERARVDGPRQKIIYDLARMREFLDRIGNPHLRVPTVHIAGTKGKGSTAALCDAAFHAAGLGTGFYSSPHLHTFRERLRRDCEPVSEEEFAGLVDDLWMLRNVDGTDTVTLFEFLTGMAFQCFDQAHAAVQTIEVGLGGKLDATNVVDAQVCVVTSVSMDHAKILGDTIGEIAADKAGIIKPGSTPVIAPQRAEALASILEACNRVGVQPVLIGRDVSWEPRGSNPKSQQFTVHGLRGSYDLDIPLLGDYQMENATTAVVAVEAMCNAQGFDMPAETLARGFASVSWPCRMEVLEREPVVIADGAHNDYSVDKLLETLPHYFQYDRLVVVAGFSRDKNVDAMVTSMAPAADLVVATQARHPRAMAIDELSELLREKGARTEPAGTPREALEYARNAAGARGLVLATGSLFLAAEVREAALGIEPEIYPTLAKKRD